MKSRYLYKGFTMPEVLVGLLLTALAGAAVIVGSYHYYRTINNVRLKDYAFERLKNYTELYKAKIAANDIPNQLSACTMSTENICLSWADDRNKPVPECRVEANELCYAIVPDNANASGTNAPRYHLTTIIRWDDTKQTEKELSFYVIQMVF